MNEDQVTISRAQGQAVVGTVGERQKTAARRRLQAIWSQQFGVVRITSVRARWWNLAGGRSPRGTYGQLPPPGWPEELPAWDHAELWGHGRAPFIAVSQPYPWLLNRDIGRFNDFANEFGLGFRISNYPSWYFPGRCWFVEWFRGDSIERD